MPPRFTYFDMISPFGEATENFREALSFTCYMQLRQCGQNKEREACRRGVYTEVRNPSKRSAAKLCDVYMQLAVDFVSKRKLYDILLVEGRRRVNLQLLLFVAALAEQCKGCLFAVLYTGLIEGVDIEHGSRISSLHFEKEHKLT